MRAAQGNDRFKVKEHNVETYTANVVDAIGYAATGTRELPLPTIQSFDAD